MKVTIFENTVEGLAVALRECAVDHEAFEEPLPVCELKDCRATCCHDGAVLSVEEASFLEELEPGSTREVAGKIRTTLIKAADDELAVGFPADFARTRCVFLDKNDYCRLQVKAMEEGCEHPWMYKPVACWMHPVLLTGGWDERPSLTIASELTDPRRIEGKAFGPLTPCGKCRGTGPPARRTLRTELEALGEISGRNFLRELNGSSHLIDKD